MSLSVAVGCSPAPGNGNGVGDDGGGSGGTGQGGVTLGGSSGSAAGGMGGTIVTQGGQNNGGTGNVCDELTIETKPVTPTVVVLVDNSSSMYEPRDQLWDALYTALMDPTTGAVKPLESKIRFGFASFRGVDGASVPEDDPACAQIETVGTVSPATVAPALDNHAAIDTVYQALGVQGRNPNNAQWETPTGHAITRVAATLAEFNADPPGPKIILLVTDGNPNTCMVGDPQCGQDQSIKAVQDAYAAGIGTFALGIGDIVSNNTGCETRWARCGIDHLQDLANAGTGQPVTQPPPDLVYQQCVAGPMGGAGVLTATYAPTGGTAMPLTATNAAAIAPALEGLLTGFVSCTVDMNAIVTGNPALGTVTVTPMGAAGRNVAINNEGDGWRIESNNYQVTLLGQACEDYKLSAEVNIQFPCNVAEPR